MKSLEAIRLAVVDINFEVNSLLKEVKDRDLIIEELQDKIQLLEASLKEACRIANYWKSMYSSVEKEFNALQDRNEVLTKIILEEGIKIDE